MKRLLATIVSIASLLGLAGTSHGQADFAARLTGNQEPPFPGVGTPAKGSGCFMLSSIGVQFYVTVEGLSGPIIAAAIEDAPPGIPGPVVRDIMPEFAGTHTAAGLWSPADAMPLTTSLVSDLVAGNLYVNVGTPAFPAGEIRGQIQLSSGVHFTANLQGTQENPSLAVAGTGAGSFTLTEEGLHYKITVRALTGAITAAHIYTGGAIGVNGPATFPITASFVGTSAQGFITGLTPAQRKELIAGNMYVNVHTVANPGGEIRGQINLDGGQEVPPLAGVGLGSASATLTPSGLLLDLTASGLSGGIIAAHFHNAPTGVNGGVVRTFTAAEFVSGTSLLVLWRSDDAPEPLTPFLMSELLNNRIYVNLHTAANPGGEVRGQLTLNTPAPAGVATYTANLTWEQEEPPIPAVPGPPLGTGTFQLVPGGLAFRVTVDGLTGGIAAAHIHNAPIGVSGGVVRGMLAPELVGPNTYAGTWSPADASPFSATMMTELIKGNLYFNVHTAAHPGGEIRGQILPASGAEFEALLTGPQETPALGVGALGTGSFTLTPYGLAFNVTADGLTGAITAAHFHNAERGVAGGVVRPFAAGEFVATNTLAGVWKPTDPSPLTPALVTELMKGNIYVNLHTAANPGGEIRGQLTLSGGKPFGTRPVGSQEVPPNVSPGKGTASMTLTDEGHVFRFSVNDMFAPTPSSGEFGDGPPGVVGPIVRPIYATEVIAAQTADGVWKTSDADPLTTTLLGDMVRGNLYLNIHTTAIPTGEIRGQIGSPRSTVGVGEPPSGEGSVLQLRNAPNPARDRTTISFYLPQRSNVRLAVYDVSGAEVAQVVRGPRDAGWHRVSFDAGRLSSGIYLYRINAGSLSLSRKMLVLR